MSLFDNIVGNIVLGIVRHGVTAFGGWLLANGLIDKASDQQLEGALLTLVPIGFSVWDKWQAKQKADAAIIAAAKGKIVPT